MIYTINEVVVWMVFMSVEIFCAFCTNYWIRHTVCTCEFERSFVWSVLFVCNCVVIANDWKIEDIDRQC